MYEQMPDGRRDVLLVFADPVLVPPAQPYGAQILAAKLAESGVTATVTWPHLARDPIAALDQEVRRVNPAIVGFSFRNLDGATAYERGSFAPLLAQYVRSIQGRAITVLGGSGFSIDPIRLLRASGADIGFVGPAEHDFDTFCGRVLTGQTVCAAAAGLPTAVLPDASEPPRLRPQHLGSPTTLHGPALAWARLVGGTVPVRTKTGCSLRCSYCVVPSIEALAYRPWNEIAAELDALAAAGCGDRIFIADGEFNLPDPHRATKIAMQIEQQFGKTLKWRCYLEAGFISDELATALARAGCTAVSVTVDSFSNDVRRLMGKQRSADVAIQGIERCLAAGLTTYMNLLAGAPGETEQTLGETAERVQRLTNDGATAFIAIGLRVYPRTPLATLARQGAHRDYVIRDGIDPALATYCAPVPPEALRDVLGELLPPSSRIIYLPVPQTDQDFYRDLADATRHLQHNNDLAAKQFLRLEQHTQRREATLGRLHAEQRRRMQHREVACH